MITLTQVMSCDPLLLLQFLLHHTLSSNTSVISTRHPQNIVPTHTPPADNGVLQKEAIAAG